VADTFTREAVAWIREQGQGRLMAPWRIAAILGTTEAEVVAVISGVTAPAAPVRAAPPRKAARRLA
jgi:hypothetical protein